MTDVQALKAAVALLTCDEFPDCQCDDCYNEWCGEPCATFQYKVADRIKEMLKQMGYPYEERRAK